MPNCPPKGSTNSYSNYSVEEVPFFLSQLEAILRGGSKKGLQLFSSASDRQWERALQQRSD